MQIHVTLLLLQWPAATGGWRQAKQQEKPATVISKIKQVIKIKFILESGMAKQNKIQCDICSKKWQMILASLSGIMLSHSINCDQLVTGYGLGSTPRSGHAG